MAVYIFERRDTLGKSWLKGKHKSLAAARGRIRLIPVPAVTRISIFNE